MHQSKLVRVVKYLLFYITTKGAGNLPLRGLCFDDVWNLYNTHKVELEKFYKDNDPAPPTDEEDQIEDEDEEESASISSLPPELIASLFVGEHPKVAADIIARGLDSDKYTPRRVARWPLEIQVFTLMCVFHQTLIGDAEVKKAFRPAPAEDESAEEESPAKKQKDAENTLGKIILGYRRDRSLLWANGQPNAGKYVLGVMIDEALIAAQRQKERQAAESDIRMMELSAMFDKEAGKTRNRVMNELRGVKNG